MLFRWKVVWTAFAIAAFAWGIGFYGPFVFLPRLVSQHGWSISMVSSAITSQFLVGAAATILLPDIHKRFGIARTTQIAILMSAAGVVAWSLAQSPWHMFGAALLGGIGWSGTSGAAINSIVAPWFDRDRAKALSVAFNGVSFGGVVLVPTWAGLIDAFSLWVAAAIISTTMIAILLPLTARYLMNVPDDLQVASCAAVSVTAKQTKSVPPTSRSGLLRNGRFLTLSSAFALALFAQTGMFAHMITRLEGALSPGTAAGLLSLTAASALIGRTAFGWLLGSHDRRLAAGLTFAIQAAGVTFLAIGNDAVSLGGGCVLFGLGAGNAISLGALIAQNDFRREDVARVVALAAAINQAVYAFAPAAVGALRDTLGGYRIPFLMIAIMQVIAGTIVVVGRVSKLDPKTSPA